MSAAADYSPNGVPWDGARAAREGWKASANPYAGGILSRLARAAWAQAHDEELNKMYAKLVAAPAESGPPLPDFGMTCPVLKISRHYDVDYGLCLLYADALIHGRYTEVDRMPAAAEEALQAHAVAYVTLMGRGK